MLRFPPVPPSEFHATLAVAEPPRGGRRQAAGPLTENLPNVCAHDRGAIGASQKIPLHSRNDQPSLVVRDVFFQQEATNRIEETPC